VTLTLDPELAEAFARMPARPAAPTSIEQMRTQAAAMTRATAGAVLPEGVDVSVFSTSAPNGLDVDMRWYAGAATTSGSALLIIHGGGMVAGAAAMFDLAMATQAAATGVPHLSVDYHLAPENSGSGPVEECYAALVWLADHAAALGVDPARIAIMGDSSGGGLAAGVALLARDRKGPVLAAQILVYPMLDDTNISQDLEIGQHATWTHEANLMGWTALLGAARGTAEVSPYTAPARATDLSGLPPTYIEVGTLDIFRDEDIAYAQRLLTAGVSTELQVRAGVPHGFTNFAPTAAVTVRAIADRQRWITGF
jgi:acetyl esterase/lipase